MVYVVFMIFIIALIYSIVKRSWLIGTYLIGVYSVSLFFAVKLARASSIDPTYNNTGFQYIVAPILFTVLILMCISPYLRKAPRIIKNNDTEFVHRLCVVGYTVSIFIILGMVLLTPYVLDSFAHGLVDIRRNMIMGDAFIQTYSISGHIGHSILRWTGWLGYINMLFLFYMLIYVRGKTLLKILLFISSFGHVWLGLLSGGRTNVIYWLLFAFFLVSLFYTELNFKGKNRILIVLGASIVALYIYFSYITKGRTEISAVFSNTTDFLDYYAGSSYYTFIYYFDKCKWHPYTLERILPLTSSFFVGRFDLREYRTLVQSHTGVKVNGFSTFIGDIYVDVGFIGMILFCIIVFIITKKVLKRDEFDLSHLIYLATIVQIPLMGVFYYSFWHLEISFSIILSLIISRYLNPNGGKIRFVFGGRNIL